MLFLMSEVALHLLLPAGRSRWRSNPSGKCLQERLTRGAVTSTIGQHILLDVHGAVLVRQQHTNLLQNVKEWLATLPTFPAPEGMSLAFWTFSFLRTGVPRSCETAPER